MIEDRAPDMTSAALSRTLYRHLAAPELTGEEPVLSKQIVNFSQLKEVQDGGGGLTTQASRQINRQQILKCQRDPHHQLFRYQQKVEDFLIIPAVRVMKLQRDVMAMLLW